MRIFSAVLLIAVAAGCARRPIIQERQVETRVVVEEKTIELPREVRYEFEPCDTAGIVRAFAIADTTAKTKIRIYNDGRRIVVRVRVDTVESIKVLRDTTRIVERVERRVKTKAPGRQKRSGAGWRGFVWGVVVGIGMSLFLLSGFSRR